MSMKKIDIERATQANATRVYIIHKQNKVVIEFLRRRDHERSTSRKFVILIVFDYKIIFFIYFFI